MRKKKSVLNLCRKKSFKTEKSYRRSLGLNKDSNCRIPIKQSTISFKKRKYQQTPLKSPRIKSFTPSKPPRNKKYRKLDFGHHQCTEEDTTFDPQIPSEMLIFKSSSPDASLMLENEMHGNINDYGYEHGLSDESVEPNVCKGDIEEMIKLMPSVLECLASVGLGNVFLDYFRQLNSGVQKPDNIAFLLWTDVIQWYKHETASSMRYNNETKTFWKLGWKLFGVGFLNYMSGFKNESQIIEGLATRGKCEPEKSNINFIVPAVRNLRAFSPYDEIIQGGRKPGIFKDVMEFMASSWKNSSLCLTFDGKKLKQGLGKDSGDIDLLGYEDGPSLSTRVTDMKSRMQSCEDEIQRISSNEEDVDIRCLPEDVKLKLICFLKTSYTIVSLDVVTVQEVRNKKEYARSQFVERGGKDWRQSKFVYVISAIDAFLHDIDKFLELTRDILGHIRQVLVYLQESDVFYVTSSSVCLELHDKFVPLVEDHTQTNQSEDTRKIKQRSQRWHKIPNTAFITGSTIYQSIGLDGLKRQRQHFDKVVCGIPEPEPSIEQKRAMEHGTNNEINGVATLVGRILPVIAPTLEFHEEGCVCIKDKDTMIMVVSPDGSLYISETKEIIAGVEIKCPVGKVHSSFPVRYYLQCLSEIEALGVEFLYYVCWTQEIQFSK